MIVPNMTERETTEEIKKDIQGVVDYTTVAIDSKWRRDVIKRNSFRCTESTLGNQDVATGGLSSMKLVQRKI